jgi:hypothetical protein
MIKTGLTESKSGKGLHTFNDPSGHPTLVTSDYASLHGTFAEVTLAGAATQTIVEARSNEGIVLTDLIVASEKSAGGKVTIQFTDGVNTINILELTAVNQQVNMSIPFRGNFAGWQACDIKVVTTGVNIDGSATVGYYRTPEETTLPFEEWDANR